MASAAPTPPLALDEAKAAADVEAGQSQPLLTQRSMLKAEGFDMSLRELSDLHVPGQEADNMRHLESLSGVRGVAEKLNVNDLRLGIDNTLEEMAKRREAFGENKFPEPPFSGWWALFFESFKDEILIILMVAAVVSLVVGSIEDSEKGWIDGVAILIAILIVAVVTATNDYKKEQQFRALRDDDESRQTVQVIRDGEQQSVLVAEVVVGDVIHLETGDKIVADGLYISGNDFKTDESSITGESDTMRKSPDAPFLLSGTTVAAGTCNMLATSVGIRSMQGAIMADTAMEAKDTPLQEKLNVMARQIGYFGTAAAILTFIALTVVWFVRKDDLQDNRDFSAAEWFIEAFIIAVTIIVVAIPEGLPLAVTISLAYSTRKMLRDQNLIRVLAACETMGNATDICSDKTGTLTENRMTVVEGWLAGDSVAFSNKETYHGEPGDSPHWNALSTNPDVRNMLKDHLAINTTVALSYDENKKPIIRGSKTEGALVLLVESFGFKYRLIRGTAPINQMSGLTSQRSRARSGGHGEMKASGPSHEDLSDLTEGRVHVVKQYAFTSERKVMSTLVRRDSKRLRLYVTGGSEFVLKRSSSILQGGGPTSGAGGRTFDDEGDAFASEIQAITSPAARRLMLDEAHKPSTPRASGVKKLTPPQVDRMMATVIRPLAEKQYRTIGVAYRDFDSEDQLPENWDTSPDTWLEDTPTIEQGLTFYGVLGIEDPLREGVTEAVDTCTKAGIRVRMVTGDNIDTARAIARQCGILKNEKDVVMEGPEFRKMTPKQVDDLLPRLAVLARSSPRDKNILVRRLNGVLPSNQKEWEEEHPDMDWETQRDVTLPGYRGEWEVSRRHKSGVVHKAVVGVTGDGTNDAPALKAADVGLSMGLSGTQVAKDSSDIVILDDKFSSIVAAVRWGRSVYDNIRKFLQFQLTVNVVALTLTFVAAVTLHEPPLTAVMMLWVNLIMDTMGALALGTEEPTDVLLQRKPFAISASLISTKMWRNIFAQSAFQLAVTLFILYTAENDGIWGIDDDYLVEHDFLDPIPAAALASTELRDAYIKNNHREVDLEEYISTFIFNTFVFCQVCNEFNARSIGNKINVFEGLTTNVLFIGVIIVTIGCQAFIIEVGGDFTGTTGLTAEHWGWSVLMGLGSFPVGVLMRLVDVKDRESDFAEYYDSAALASRAGSGPDEVSVEVVKSQPSGKAQVAPLETKPVPVATN